MSVELLLIIVFVGAFLSPFLARLLRMPVPVGELVFGLCLGFLLRGESGTPEIVSFLSEFGFLLLMFLAGLEVDFNLIERTQGRSITFYTLYTLSIPASAVALSYMLGFSLYASLILSLISVGLMVATLKDMGVTNTPLSKRVLILGVVGEVVSLFLLTAIEKMGRFHGWGVLALEVLWIALFFAGFVLLFKLLKLLLWWYPEILKRLTQEDDPSAIDIRLSLMLMFSTAVLAHMTGVESVLGAFLAGMVLSFFVRKKHELEERLSSIGYGFLIPIFFIETGMSMRVSEVSERTLGTVAVILLLILLVRLLPAPMLVLGGFSLRESIMSAVLLSYPFTLMIAGIEIAKSTGLIESELALSMFIGASLSSLLFPWGAKLLLRVLR